MAIPNRVVERELPHQAGPAEGDGPEVRLAADGDADAFERLYHRNVGRVYSLACRMVGTEHPAEVTQDVFVRAWQKLHTFRGEAAFGSWLYRLAINVVYGRQRTLSTRRDRFVSNEIPLARASSKERTVELAMDFETAIECLPDGARQIFVLHDVEGYKHREIADMLEITQGTSKSQLHRARMILREHLDR
jgi:RNA polymerase sigma-70 factor (ECF subfamily)